MVKTYANNSKNFEHGKSLFFPKAKTCGNINKPCHGGTLMGRYVMTSGKKRS